MPVQIRDGGSWKTVGANGMWIRDGGSWKQAKAAWVRDGGSWKQVHQQSDPVVTTIEMLGWCQTYRGSGPVSGGSNRDALLYAGDGWNSEQEIGMAGILNFSTIQAALAERPNATAATFYLWVGHRYSGTGTVHVGWHDRSSQPGSWSQSYRKGSGESDTAWKTDITWPKPGSGTGQQVSNTMSSTVRQNVVDGIIAGNTYGIVVSDEGSNGNPDWGWFMGTERSTSNSGGSSGGMTPISSGQAYAARMVVTHDYA